MRLLNVKLGCLCLAIVAFWWREPPHAWSQEKPPAPVRFPQRASTTVPLDSWVYPALDRLAMEEVRLIEIDRALGAGNGLQTDCAQLSVFAECS